VNRKAVFSGARQGELSGLRRCDVSFNNGGLYDPKNRTSRRRIDPGDDVMLREYRKANLLNDLVLKQRF